jgi:hypothetical protein
MAALQPRCHQAPPGAHGWGLAWQADRRATPKVIPKAIPLSAPYLGLRHDHEVVGVVDVGVEIQIVFQIEISGAWTARRSGRRRRRRRRRAAGARGVAPVGIASRSWRDAAAAVGAAARPAAGRVGRRCVRLAVGGRAPGAAAALQAQLQGQQADGRLGLRGRRRLALLGAASLIGDSERGSR